MVWRQTEKLVFEAYKTNYERHWKLSLELISNTNKKPLLSVNDKWGIFKITVLQYYTDAF